MSEYEYICPSCGKPMDVYEPHVERSIFKNEPEWVSIGMATCQKCQIKVMSPYRTTNVNDSAHKEEELAKARAAFDNMIKSFGIKKRLKPKPCPSCGGVDFYVYRSEPQEFKGQWFASLAQIECEDCGFRLGAGGADSIDEDEAQKLADLANKTVINTWNSMERD